MLCLTAANKEKLLPDDFPQTVFHFLKVRAFFWILIPTAFYQHVHLGRASTQWYRHIRLTLQYTCHT